MAKMRLQHAIAAHHERAPNCVWNLPARPWRIILAMAASSSPATKFCDRGSCVRSPILETLLNKPFNKRKRFRSAREETADDRSHGSSPVHPA